MVQNFKFLIFSHSANIFKVSRLIVFKIMTIRGGLRNQVKFTLLRIFVSLRPVEFYDISTHMVY